MPRCERASGRFGVISMSNTVSPGGSTSLIGVPSAGEPSKMRRPLPAGRPISSGPHIMPCDSCPYFFDWVILKSPGKTAPGKATGTRRPGSQLCAPQTMDFTPPAGPTSTVQSEISFLGFGTLVRVRISPTTTRSSFGAPVLMMPSTSKPRKVIAREISSLEIPARAT
jgi:hypothetical protein